jgi:plasmid stabilization system protein ParE
MKKYQVKITGKALADMEAIYDYIASNLQSPDTAMRKYDRIAVAIESLDTFPERCRLFDSEPEYSYGMRQFWWTTTPLFMWWEIWKLLF